MAQLLYDVQIKLEKTLFPPFGVGRIIRMGFSESIRGVVGPSREHSSFQPC
jgi:hypothetical protein